MWNHVAGYQHFCRNMLPHVPLHLEPSLYPYLAAASSSWHFSKFVQDCMLHIPESTVLHGCHPKNLKTRTDASLSMHCLMRLKIMPNYCDTRFEQWISAKLVSLSQLCFPCHSALCMNVWQKWHDFSIIPRSNTTWCFSFPASQVATEGEGIGWHRNDWRTV
jgi:hypothetical protein